MNVFCIQFLTYIGGGGGERWCHSVVQTVCRRPLTLKTLLQSQSSPSGIYVEPSDNGTVIVQSLLFSLLILLLQRPLLIR